jgi:hypothetical protein
MRCRVIHQWPVFVLLLAAGCASNFNIRYEPIIDGEMTDRNNPVRIVRVSEKSLFADGYCKIGRVGVSYSIDDGGQRSNDAVESQMQKEAGRRGGDLVRIETENVFNEKKGFKSGACLLRESAIVEVETPVYKEECRVDVFGSRQCVTSRERNVTEKKFENMCAKWEQIPIVLKTMTATGSVWRHDASVCATLAGLDVLASAQSYPHHIAVNAEKIYWTNSGTEKNSFTDGAVMTMPIAGGSATTLANGLSQVKGIAADAKNVYWASSGTERNNFTDSAVMMMPAGGGAAAIKLASGQAHINDIAVDAKNIYWTTQGTVAKMHTDGTVMMVPIAGGTPTCLASGRYYTNGIAVDAENIYWIDKGNAGKRYTDGAVMKMPIRGGEPVVLASGQREPEWIAVDDTSVYWTNSRETVMRAPIQGGSSSALASGQRNIQGIAVYGKNVYWVNAGKKGDDGSYGTVMILPVSGGTPKPVASAQRSPAGIAADGSGIYWTSRNGGRVMKLMQQQ